MCYLLINSRAVNDVLVFLVSLVKLEGWASDKNGHNDTKKCLPKNASNYCGINIIGASHLVI